MKIDYFDVGKRIAKRRKALGLKQSQVSEIAEISDKYLSCIERATSIPSLEVLMRLAKALDTTPDEFLVGTAGINYDDWKEIAQIMKNMTPKQLELAKNFLLWIKDQEL